MPTRDTVYYFHNDVSGLPEELTDVDGELVWQARYKVWGNAVQEEWIARAQQRPAPVWDEMQPAAAPAHVPRPQNQRFQGQYLDRETGLHYNTFRVYDPDIGRFIHPDPIGLAGGTNLFQYAPNSLGWIDPWGLSCADTAALTKHAQDTRSAVLARANKGMTDRQLASIERSLDRAKTATTEEGRALHLTRAATKERLYVGQRMDAEFEMRVANDPSLAHLTVTKSGQFGADVVNRKTGSWWDLTTENDWSRGMHQAKYGDGGSGLFWVR
ncbi:RHS repeat-associated core domain-containing protein [Burkholderia aenigmatica]|uniref:RHS repeat-associated core domain-containing protein n=1 Tax=Burkholderia aenigmatica TaxID=2015348 RepID=UPI003B43895B